MDAQYLIRGEMNIIQKKLQRERRLKGSSQRNIPHHFFQQPKTPKKNYVTVKPTLVL